MESKPINLGPVQSAAYYQSIAAGSAPVNKKGPASQPDQKHDPEDVVSLGDGGINPDEAKYFTKGNKVTPLFDGEPIFSTAEEMLKGAKSNIQLEMYSLNNKKMVNLLCEEAQKGIKVQVIMDPTPGTTPAQDESKKATIEQLKASGVEVVTYPVDEKKKQIDHVKLLIVDGKSVLMGGMNWGEHSPYNHDADLKIDGPAANYYERAFASSWRKSGGEDFDPLPVAKEVEGGESLVNSAASELGQKSNLAMVLRNISEAKESIHAEMFVLSDRSVIKGLIDAHNRGVDVKVLLDPNGAGEGSWNPNGRTFETLKKAGVPVKWYDVDTSVQEKLHAKWAVFDGNEVINGSANWSYKGLNVNREIASNVVDKGVASAFEKQFDYDWNNKGLDKLPNVPDGDGSNPAPPKFKMAPRNE